MAPQQDRMRENEELFRMANERLRAQIADAVTAKTSVPFLCECVDELCMARLEMTLDDYRGVRAEEDTFAVAPGHAAGAGEEVVEEHDSFHVVRKEAA
jgi:hypothetical protein